MIYKETKNIPPQNLSIKMKSTAPGKGGNTVEDSQIIELYWQRDEQAIAETAQKYGAFCFTIASSILTVREDAEECINDTYHQVWNAIPPQRPIRFRPWLGRIVRNAAINLWNKNHTQKRYAGMTALLHELEECIPAPQTAEQSLEEKELTQLIERWLRSLSPEDRILFVRRYWYGVPLQELAAQQGILPGKLAGRMHRLRSALKTVLEREGICL